MIPGYALLRLLARPMTLIPALIILGSIPALRAAGPLIDAMTGMPGASAWRTIMVAPALVGLFVAIFRLELQHTRLGWVLPGVRGGVAAGVTVVAVIVAAAFVWLTGAAATGRTALGVFAVAVTSFALSGVIVDAVLPRAARLAAALLLSAGVAVPVQTARLALDVPAAAGAFAAAVFGAALAGWMTGRGVRLRAVRWSVFAPGSAAHLYWTKRRPARRSWSGRLDTAATGMWLKAAAFASVRGFPTGHLRTSAVFAVAAVLMNAPYMIVIALPAFLAEAGTQLHGALTYPLSRSRRADVAFAGTLLDAGVLLGAGVLVALALTALGVAPLPMFADESARHGYWLQAGFGLVSAPILLYDAARRAALARPVASADASYVAVAALYGLAAIGGAEMTRRMFADAPTAATAGVAVLAVLVHATHWLVLRRFFARADLGAAAQPSR
jgi:hypothetical protein